MNTDDPQQHIDTLADLIEATEFICETDEQRDVVARADAARIFASTDPAVHDALTAALHANADRARILAAHADAGWLDEEFNVAGEDEDGGWVIDTEMSRDEASKLAARHDGFVTRRLVTPWEPTP